MKLRMRLVLFIGLVIVLTNGIIMLTSHIFLLESYTDLEKQNALQNLKRGLNAVDSEISYLKGVAGDWAEWDDTYNYIATRDEAYLQSNMVDSTFIELRLNLLLLLDQSGDVVWGKTFDLEEERVNEEFPDQWDQIRTNKVLCRHRSPDSIVGGIVMMPKGPMLIASRPILTSEGEGPVRGTLIMGRYLNQVAIEKLSQRTELSLALTPFSKSKNLTEHSDPVETAPYLAIQVHSQDTLTGYSVLRDIHDTPILVLSLDMSRDILQEGQATIHYFWGWTLSASIILGMLIYLMLDRVLSSQHKQRESEELLRQLAGQSGDAFFLSEAGGAFLDLNQQACNYLGYSRSELLNLSWSDLETNSSVFENLPNHDIEQFPRTAEVNLLRKDGSFFPAEVSLSLVASEARRFLLVMARDISERKQAEEKVRQLAFFDPLTHLPNRLLLQNRLIQSLGKVEREEILGALLFFDLDRFKEVNDTLGHANGDLLLREIAERLQSCLRQTDTVARMGGDEFVVLLPEIKTERDAIFVAQKALERIAAPMALDGHEVHTTASIGIVLYPPDGQNADALLKHADTAMYAAKDRGRNTFQFFSEEMNHRAMERRDMENNLRQGLQKNEFHIVFQPQVEQKTGKLIGAEALLRWRHPAKGLIPPSRFIPLAEDTGLIRPIGEWVLREACRQNQAWKAAGYEPLKIAVNISGVQFKHNDFIQTVTHILHETGMDSNLLELELTESVLMGRSVDTIAVLSNLKGSGIHLAIDDFGIGYSSLSYLKNFPIDRLKIDQSLVRDISTDPNDAAIVEAILAMGHSLGLRVVAEGVETQEHVEFLSSRDCHEMQGYYFGRPMPAKDLEKLLTKRVLTQ